MKNILQRTREWDTSGLHQSISLKGRWELASSQWSSRIMAGVQREDRREEERERDRDRERGQLPQSSDLPPMCRGAFPWLSLRLRCSQMSQSQNPGGTRQRLKRLAVSEGHITRDCGEQNLWILRPWSALWHCLIDNWSFITMNPHVASHSVTFREKYHAKRELLSVTQEEL